MNPKLRPWLPIIPYVIATGLAAWALPHAPAHVPTHWGPDGNPDAWGSPFMGYFQLILFLLPASLVLIALQMYSRADRHNAPILNLLNHGLSLFTLIQTVTVIYHWDGVKTLLIGLGLLFTFLGNSLGKAHPSAFLGIRTPWVYLSRRAWYATHRRAALWFVLYGLSLLLPGLLLSRTTLVPVLYPFWLTTGSLVLIIGLIFGSYLDYKHDPEPQPVDLRS